jgi:heme-degrading monooxygenase HmoA
MGRRFSMIVERLELTVLDGQEAAFEAVLCDVRQDVFMSKGFREFTVARGVEDPSVYLIEVLWETLDEHTEYVGSGRFATCWAPVRPFLAAAPRGDRFEQRQSLSFR